MEATTVSSHIISAPAHRISHEAISEGALKVIHRLREAGYGACLVGGCVRDLMLGREPKDFDVVTQATPEEVKAVFRGCRLVGRRFRLAHVRVGREIIEVATFRGRPDDGAGNNVYGTQEEDAVRRDFTVNALYYDPQTRTITDYVGGVADLEAGLLRMIGDPSQRYREDPVRMLRAIRFAAKLGFQIEARSAAPLRELAPLLQSVPPARLFEEVLKLFHGGYALDTFELLRHHGVFEPLFPATEKCLGQEREGFPLTLLSRALQNTDRRIEEDKPVTPAFLFAALLWEPVRLQAEARVREGTSLHDALHLACERVLQEQLSVVALPKRFSAPMREIWMMQSRFHRRSGRHPFRLIEHKRFRAAYDFLLLRCESGEEEPALGDWWTRFQAGSHEEREALVAAVPAADGQKRKRRRRRRTSGRGSK